jgi:hypothetical protein
MMNVNMRKISVFIHVSLDGFFEPLYAIILILFAILMIRILYPNSLALLRKHKDDFNYI